MNAGKSKSQGVELEAQASFTENLTMTMGVAYNDSTLTEDIPNVSGFGVKGDNLPGSADYNINLGLQYHFTLAGHDAFIRSDYTYVGEFYNNFSEAGQPAGGYSQINLKAGIKLNQFDVELFVNNLTNADDFTWIEALYSDFGGANRAYRLKPRTVGLNVGYQF